MSDPDIIVIVTVTVTDDGNAQFSYAPGGTPTAGWSVDSYGSVMPPSTGPGSGTLEFQLKTSGTNFAGFFAGFNVAQSTTAISGENWASVAELAECHLLPSQPLPWPSTGTISGPLVLTLDYGSPEASSGHYCKYRVSVQIGNEKYSDDPKIYTDPIT